MIESQHSISFPIFVYILETIVMLLQKHHQHDAKHHIFYIFLRFPQWDRLLQLLKFLLSSLHKEEFLHFLKFIE